MFKYPKLYRGLAATLALIMAILLCTTALAFENQGVVNMLLNVSNSNPTTEFNGDAVYYKTAFTEDGIPSDEGLQKLIAAQDTHNTRVMEEGSVLVKNEADALPLKAEERRVTLFGRATADPVYRASTAGPALEESRLIDLKGALETAGFSVNETLYNAYKASSTKRSMADRNIGEEDISFYTSSLQESFADDYHDVAIVMFSRYAGEGNDLRVKDADGVPQLSLHQQEKDLLTMIKDSGKFAKTIVLINSGYAVELEWVNDPAYGVDACLWIGNPGLTGFTGVANLLVGAASPSGRFADTYATSSLSSAAMVNAGDFTYRNAGEIGDYCAANGGGASYSKYLVEAEGIYVGYKYYETRYQDQVLGINNADSEKGAVISEGGWDYASEMSFPFGYGLSYSTFTQKLDSVEWDSETHTVTAKVTVTNTTPSDAAYTGSDKSTVQLYAQLPYEAGQAQKSAIQLIGYGKTGALNPGESETVTITADDYLFATYDEKAVNGADNTKNGAYVFDAGTYYFSIGENCHDALNNVMAKKNISGMFNPEGKPVSGDAAKVQSLDKDYDNLTYAVSQYTGQVVSNALQDADLNYYQPDTVTYMTRDDWNTFPDAYTDISATADMMVELNGYTYQKPADAPAVSDITVGAENGIKLIDMKDVPWEDEETWNKFLDQLTVADLCQITTTYWGSKSIASVEKPPHIDGDGPDGYASRYNFGNKENCTTYANQCVLATTWNADLIRERGSLIGEDALYATVHQLWCPGADIHRTPYSGRNFEYYSEDSILSYLDVAIECEAMQEKGVQAAPKHLCGNDQETNRGGVSTFLTEQALRQGPLKGFEGAFTVGGALGTMTSMNRIGCTALTSHSEIQNDVLRGEWGFKGVCIADASNENYNHALEALVGGTDMFCLSNNKYKTYQAAINKDGDGYILECLKYTNKRYYYSFVRTSLINGLTPEVKVADTANWWEPVLIAANCVVGAAFAAAAVLYAIASKKQKGAMRDSTVKGKRGPGAYLCAAAGLIAAVSAVVYIIVAYGDKTFSLPAFVCMLLGGIAGLSILFTGFSFIPLVSAVLAAAGILFHFYTGVPSVTDIINDINFIGGNGWYCIYFGIAFMIAAVTAVISCYLKERKL